MLRHVPFATENCAFHTLFCQTQCSTARQMINRAFQSTQQDACDRPAAQLRFSSSPHRTRPCDIIESMRTCLHAEVTHFKSPTTMKPSSESLPATSAASGGLNEATNASMLCAGSGFASSSSLFFFFFFSPLDAAAAASKSLATFSSASCNNYYSRFSIAVNREQRDEPRDPSACEQRRAAAAVKLSLWGSSPRVPRQLCAPPAAQLCDPCRPRQLSRQP